MVQPLENQTQIILDSIADGVFTVDGEKKITSFNRAAEKITGIKKRKPSAVIVGRYLRPVFAKSDVPCRKLWKRGAP